MRTIVCDSDPRHADVAVSTEDREGVRRTARGADGLIAPGTDWPVRIAAEAAEELGIPHPITASVAVTCTNKIAQRTRLDESGVPQPRWSTDAPPSYPCVVKAPDRQGQRAMTMLRDSGGLDAAADRARRGSRSGRVLYEEFVPGPEVTVNAFSAGGRFVPVTVTDRIHFEGVPGVARRHVFPAAASGAGEAARVAEAAVAAVGIGAGPSYIQLILADDGPRVVEVAARLGGGHDSEICRAAAGVDLAAAAVLAAVGEEVAAESLEPHRNGAAVIEFLAAPPGRLVAASGPPDVRFFDEPGHVYGPLRIATDRAGYVLATAPDRAGALRSAAEAVEAVRFEVR
jgi:biotin carboxylase